MLEPLKDMRQGLYQGLHDQMLPNLLAEPESFRKKLLEQILSGGKFGQFQGTTNKDCKDQCLHLFHMFWVNLSGGFQSPFKMITREPLTFRVANKTSNWVPAKYGLLVAKHQQSQYVFYYR